jgi:hypothetical protein
VLTSKRDAEEASMPQLVYHEAEILQEHDYAAPHLAAGYRLHGGFDAEGRYLSPRSAVRPDAVRAWQERLVEDGHELLPVAPSLLEGRGYPSFDQVRLMLRHGIDRGLWNTLTITGMVEGRGRMLIGLRAPDFAPLVEEDVADRALGHLNRGLLRAHGLDEGGDLERKLGGHDAMWFAIRDLVLGKDRHPLPEVPPRIGRPDEGVRLAPDLPQAHEQILLLLANVLLIEIRAETLFASTERLLRDPELFVERRAEAEEATEMVRRIRQDEEVHVEYLRTVLSEMRALHFRTQTGIRRGADIVDPVWNTLLDWHAVENPRLAREQQRRITRERILEHPDGAGILEAFLALEADDAGPATPAS